MAATAARSSTRSRASGTAAPNGAAQAHFAQAGQAVKSAAEHAIQGVSAEAEHLKERGAQILNSAKAQGQDTTVKAEGFVRERPWAAVGVAAAAGALIGLWLKR